MWCEMAEVSSFRLKKLHPLYCFFFRGNGVEKIFKLEDVAPNFNEAIVFYFINNNMKVFKQVIDQIRSQVNIENPIPNKFHIIVFPKYMFTFEDELEQFGLYHDIVRLHSFQWMPIHLDEGILSLEIQNLYSSLFVYNNMMLLPCLSKALWQLSLVIGKPRFVLSLGQYSNMLLTQYEMLCEQKGESDKFDCEFGALLIMDRSIDYQSVLLTPGTYTALLAEVYHVKTGICEKSVDNDKEALDKKFNPIPEQHKVCFNLDSTHDSVYANIKNRYFTEVTSVLSDLTKRLKSEKMSSKEMALDEIKHYVQTQLQATQSRKKFITNHLLAAESIISVLGHRFENQKLIEHNIIQNNDKSSNYNFLEELLVMENDKLITLRLFCLLSITQTLTESEIKPFWRKYLHQFGFDYGFGYQNLINAGFLTEPSQSTTSLNIPEKLKIPKFSTSNFHQIAKNLKQIPPNPDKINLKYPTCPSYVYGGTYIPLIVQILSMILNSTDLDDIKSKLEILGNLKVQNDRSFPISSRTILVYLVGGISYAEIAACNLLETVTGAKIYVLSDTIITGNDIVKGILEYPK